MDEKKAQNIIDTIETFEFLSQLTLKQLRGLQNMISYAIDEKESEKETVLLELRFMKGKVDH